MRKRQEKSPGLVGKRGMAESVTEVFDDCTITVRGDEVWMSGRLAERLAEVARQANTSLEEVFNLCLRIGLPMVVAEHRAAQAAKAAKGKRSRGSRAKEAKERR